MFRSRTCTGAFWCVRTARTLLGGVDRVLEKTTTGLAAELPGGNHAAEERARAVFRIPETVMEDVHDRKAHVQADEVRERQRSHRMVHAELHHRVDRLRRAYTFHQREDGFIDHR